MRKSRFFIVAFLCVTLFTGCTTILHTRNGKRWIYVKPLMINVHNRPQDMQAFDFKHFELSDYSHKTGSQEGRRLVEAVDASDAKALLKNGGTYYLYFYLPGCAAAPAKVRMLDSLAKTGRPIILISLKGSYNTIDHRLKGTHFANYPYYVLDDAKYSGAPALRQVKFIKECCGKCYDIYRDEVMFAEFLLIRKGIPELRIH